MTGKLDQTKNDLSKSVSIRTLSIIMGIVAVALSIACLTTIRRVSTSYADYASATEAYLTCQEAADQMLAGSDYLTTEVRLFVSTHDIQHITHYFLEINGYHRREHAVEALEAYLGDSQARSYLDEALSYSNDLKQIELYGMRLAAEGLGEQIPAEASQVKNVTLTAEDEALSAEEKLYKAQQMMFDETYQRYDDLIDQTVNLCKGDLLNRMGTERDRVSRILDDALFQMELFIVLIVITFLVTLIGFSLLVLRPLYRFVKRIEQSEPLDTAGSTELRYLSHTYNAMYEQSRRVTERLRRKSEMDGLTGIYNREVFNRLLEESDDKEVALLLIDVDHFKEVNDTYGHVMGDRALQKVASQLESGFRASDFPCRVGGDEFAVLMMGVVDGMEPVISEKINAIRSVLLDDSDGVPPITLSIGIAFGPLEADAPSDATLYTRADEALYKVKEAGRNGFGFWHKH